MLEFSYSIAHEFPHILVYHNNLYDNFYNIYISVSADGHFIYSEVRAFLNKQDERLGMYKSITTASNTLHLSQNHLIYARKQSDKFYPM